MKNIALNVIILFSVLVLSSYAPAEGHVRMKKILGEWEYTIPDAPYEYQNGLLILAKEEGELTGEHSIGGQGMPLDDVVYKKSNLKATIDIQGEHVKFDLNFTKKTLEGSVSYSAGKLKMTGQKK